MERRRFVDGKTKKKRNWLSVGERAKTLITEMGGRYEFVESARTNLLDDNDSNFFFFRRNTYLGQTSQECSIRVTTLVPIWKIITRGVSEKLSTGVDLRESER